MPQYNYQPLAVGTSENTSTKDPTYSRKPRLLVAGSIISLAWALALALVSAYHSASPKPVSYTYNDSDDRTFECGTTVSDAMAAGCEYDPVTFSWLPERCLDRELAFELTHNTTWALHADLAGKIERSDLEFASNKSKTYITHGNHVVHCIYVWRRMHRMLLAGKPVHSGMAYRHTIHCTEVILDSFDYQLDQVQNTATVLVPAF